MLSYKTALAAKGIKPIPPYQELRSAQAGDREILNPALALQRLNELSGTFNAGKPTAA